MSDQPTTEELRAAFGLTSDGGLTPEAFMEMKRRRDALQDQIARDMFPVLYDKEFAKYWFDQNCTKQGTLGCHDGEAKRAARAAFDIAALAAHEIVHKWCEEDDRHRMFEEFIEERGEE
jgi:hypothetical protein